jgi:hypothetical protein
VRGATLKVVFPKLFSFSYIRDASVVDYFQFSNGSPKWNVNFVRAAHN